MKACKQHTYFKKHENKKPLSKFSSWLIVRSWQHFVLLPYGALRILRKRDHRAALTVIAYQECQAFWTGGSRARDYVVSAHNYAKTCTISTEKIGSSAGHTQFKTFDIFGFWWILDTNWSESLQYKADYNHRIISDSVQHVTFLRSVWHWTRSAAAYTAG